MAVDSCKSSKHVLHIHVFQWSHCYIAMSSRKRHVLSYLLTQPHRPVIWCVFWCESIYWWGGCGGSMLMVPHHQVLRMRTKYEL